MLLDDLRIYQLYLEGAAEDMVTSSLTKLQAPQDVIQFFLQKENGKLVFKPEHVPTLYSWIKDQQADKRTLVDDYRSYQKFFQNIPLNHFKTYLEWTEKVHAKRDESEYQSRNKDLKDIDISGEDKENVLANDDDVLILKGDDEHKCVRYGRGYSFCISRGGGGNMYGTYRLAKSSTFYFIFFKKIPKEDERHVMVLDRTADGWEWTFGTNKTKVVHGGWKEIIKSFPVLVKYEKLFTNKPLTNEEKEYQDKLRAFVQSPSLEKFKQFSYKEKADVLKFGMLIPLDLFQSLDKYLRNEWVSVGPKMSDGIYKLLNDKERERFAIVRKQQLTLRKPEDKFDVEICENDPELFKKHLRRDKKLCEEQEKQIHKLIVNGVCEQDIRITSKYFFPNLDDLKEARGDIYANLAQTISLPQLTKSGDIIANLAQTVSLPQLTKSKYIGANSAQTVSLPQLIESGNIYADSAKKIKISSKLKSKLKNVPQDCEFFEPSSEEQLNDSFMHKNKVVLESFKQYVSRV